MIRNLRISGFRCFGAFVSNNLARVNLLVGHNNAGKTTILEAIQTLIRRGDPLALDSFMSRRGETIYSGSDVMGPPQFELDIRRLFHGHRLEPEASLSIESSGNNDERAIRFRIRANLTSTKATSTTTTTPSPNTGIVNDSFWLVVDTERANRGEWHREIRLSSAGGIDPFVTGLSETVSDQLEHVNFVPTDQAIKREVADAWGEVALTEDEKHVEDCLRIIEPSLQRVAFVKDRTTEQGVFRVKLEHQKNPIPVGSLGGGTGRLLALSIALVQSKNGFLLIDEIDTGLHHAILADVWKFVVESAERLNVQVFATTHSLDCIRGLAQVCDASRPSGEDRISMHRIERGKPESIHYSEQQIIIAAERGIETR